MNLDILSRYGIVEILEEKAEQNNNGSIFRACLAISRAAKNEQDIEEKATLFALQNEYKKEALDHLEKFSKENKNHQGELREAFIALENAIELARKKQAQSTVKDREDLWIRLDRLID